MGRFMMVPDRSKKDEGALTKICRDTSKMATEQIKGLSNQIIKDLLFNTRPLLQNGAAVQQKLGALAAVTGTAPMEL